MEARASRMERGRVLLGRWAGSHATTEDAGQDGTVLLFVCKRRTGKRS